MTQDDKPPRISVVVIGYRMRRELPRTILSLSPAYQRLGPQHYEILLSEMPSDEMLREEDMAGFPPNLVYAAERENLPLSVAVNRAVRRTRGTHVLICVDGARIVSPALLQRCRQVLRLHPTGVLATHGMHLGVRPQQIAVPDGTHSAGIEDALLEGIEFPNRPYHLFSIACWAGSSRHGWFGPMAESCALMVAREHFEELGGYDEAVTTPGGGLANSDFYTRAISDTRRPLFIPLGEATFHQHHGGTTTSAQVRGAWGALKASFEAETGRPFVLAPERNPQYIGALPPQAVPLALTSMLSAQREEEARRPAQGFEMLECLQAGGVALPDRAAPRAPVTLVVGMHRSGTSFLARQMTANGFTVPGTPMGGTNRSNPEGHFEPLELVAFHNALLADLRLSWSALGPADLSRPGVIERQARTLQRLLLAFDAADTPESHAGWVLKDPRICRTVPIWQRAAALMGITPSTLLVLRDPTLVAQSLHKRDGFGTDFARLLWARYVDGMLDFAESADDILCLDGAGAAEVAAYLARRTGCEGAREGFVCEPVATPELPPACDPITALYRTFLRTRDLAGLRAGLKGELALLDRYPGVLARLDRIAGLPDEV
ncbi:hypothetical protein [Acuticoccus sediminis]|uniref:hypothetical protein n=1 Tax=Acuticoccus sediminis TaxID=2184697 RepID=UPI001CFCAE9A|nr:hypothetical protein [Acuticoccus sediminis]